MNNKIVKLHVDVMMLKEKEDSLRLRPETISTQFTRKGDLYAST